MKQFTFLFVCFLFTGFCNVSAKGCGGGHSCGAGVGVVGCGYHDPFSKIRNESFPGYIVYKNDTIAGDL